MSSDHSCRKAWLAEVYPSIEASNILRTSRSPACNEKSVIEHSHPSNDYQLSSALIFGNTYLQKISSQKFIISITLTATPERSPIPSPHISHFRTSCMSAGSLGSGISLERIMFGPSAHTSIFIVISFMSPNKLKNPEPSTKIFSPTLR